jgi:hypothetical protein
MMRDPPIQYQLGHQVLSEGEMATVEHFPQHFIALNPPIQPGGSVGISFGKHFKSWLGLSEQLRASAKWNPAGFAFSL